MRVAEHHLIIDPPASGAWNMAVDEALLIDAADSGIATLRFYQWDVPTLSLGYFQAYDDRHQHAASGDCVCVRRQTGGGAIVHDPGVKAWLGLSERAHLLGFLYIGYPAMTSQRSLRTPAAELTTWRGWDDTRSAPPSPANPCVFITTMGPSGVSNAQTIRSLRAKRLGTLAAVAELTLNRSPGTKRATLSVPASGMCTRW